MFLKRRHRYSYGRALDAQHLGQRFLRQRDDILAVTPFARFEQLERRADLVEGHADALSLRAPKTLEEEITELRTAEKVDAELDAMKAARSAAH